jgi:hypothetical protein
MKTAHLSLMSGIVALSFALMGAVFAESPYKSSSDFSKYAEKMRESALLHLEPQVIVPTAARPFSFGSSSYPWKNDIVTTIFWVGESASARNPVHNRSSSWDLNWESSFGGFDDPDPTHRRNFIPVNFVPRQNPFYCALPYNDVTHGATKPEAALVIPWFKNAFVRPGQSVCHDRWVAIRSRVSRKICYAQWSDCGPFRTDHYQYVFGDERPKPNLNQGAGLDVSPSVRDYLGLGPSFDTTDWRFVEYHEVPKGPWSQYGDNNTFVQQARGSIERVANASGSSTPKATITTTQRPSEEPRLLLK